MEYIKLYTRKLIIWITMQLLYCNPIYPPSYFHQRYDSISVTTTMYGKVIINTANHQHSQKWKLLSVNAKYSWFSIFFIIIYLFSGFFKILIPQYKFYFVGTIYFNNSKQVHIYKYTKANIKLLIKPDFL